MTTAIRRVRSVGRLTDALVCGHGIFEHERFTLDPQRLKSLWVLKRPSIRMRSPRCSMQSQLLRAASSSRHSEFDSRDAKPPENHGTYGT